MLAVPVLKVTSQAGSHLRCWKSSEEVRFQKDQNLSSPSAQLSGPLPTATPYLPSRECSLT